MCVGLGSPKAALDVVNNELYCFLSFGGSSSGWWPGNAVGSLAKMQKQNNFFKIFIWSWIWIKFEPVDQEFVLSVTMK